MSSPRSNLQRGLVFIFLLAAAGCTAPLPASPSPTAPAAPNPTSTAAPPTLLPPTPSALPSPAPSPTPQAEICSPLQGQSFADLSSPDLLKTPFKAARPGFDDGHPAIDLAYWTNAAGQPMLGQPISAVLEGRVAAVIVDRPPYGNAIILETPLSELPASWLARLDLPSPAVSLQPSFSLACPDMGALPNPSAPRAIFTLYAHMRQPSPLQPGDRAACGQKIGEVGTTGNSVNPHLHLEMRVGAAGSIDFTSLAHYDTRASAEERQAYCRWRISGAFLPFDPLKVFDLKK